MKTITTSFAPHLSIKVLEPAVDFYQRAFGATLRRSFDNPDGSIHVAEMEIDGCIFHLHEETPRSHQLSPETLNATTSLIGLFTPDPDQMVQQAIAAGGVSSGVQDFDYGLRQGIVIDPFGHQWLIQKWI